MDGEVNAALHAVGSSGDVECLLWHRFGFVVDFFAEADVEVATKRADAGSHQIRRVHSRLVLFYFTFKQYVDRNLRLVVGPHNVDIGHDVVAADVALRLIEIGRCHDGAIEEGEFNGFVLAEDNAVEAVCRHTDRRQEDVAQRNVAEGEVVNGEVNAALGSIDSCGHVERLAGHRFGFVIDFFAEADVEVASILSGNLFSQLCRSRSGHCHSGAKSK